MQDTGRLKRSVTGRARRMLFGDTADHSIDTELGAICQVDRAHLVMLVEAGILDAPRAARLLAAIDALRAADFAPLRGRAAPRGLFLLYESYLIDVLGPEIGGALHTGRSRNDLNATTLRMGLRSVYASLQRESLRLEAILLRRARRFARVVMPIHTHYQAALPSTYGHYLAGVATALDRSSAALATAAEELDVCPLGAGAVGGTSLPIRTERSARLLGFTRALESSVEAVASRDFALRLLAAAAILGVTLGRLATDLLLWTTGDLGFLHLPDDLVGSSSMMPQKRNAFLLEHVQGRSAAPLGAFVSAATAMHAKPFTNSIAVGTEGVSPVRDALRRVTEAVILARLVVAGAEPRPEVMRRAAERGHVTATELANRLVISGDMSFREAHHTVGALVGVAMERELPLAEVATAQLPGHIALGRLSPAEVAIDTCHGGGPGATDRTLDGLEASWRARAARFRARVRHWQDADRALDQAVAEIG